MPNWENSDRRLRLPDNWPVIRRRILRRDGHQCTYVEDGLRCDERATDVDHIRAGDNHADSNLRSLCSAHHRTKSSREGAIALHRKRKAINNRFRRSEDHPGLL